MDSQLYEQIPFQTAVDDGCTHVLVLRSRPDGGLCSLFVHFWLWFLGPAVSPPVLF